MMSLENVLTIVFLIALGIVFYTYIGYGIIMMALVKIKRIFSKKQEDSSQYVEAITMIVPCYNEGDFIVEKIKNTLSLDYPKDKVEYIFITDGSDDHSMDLIQPFEPEIKWMHDAKRRGKAAAMNRAMAEAKNPILVFCDANTLLNKTALYHLIAPYRDQKVGAVTGEKKILSTDESGVSTEGEGMYWKYESLLKKLDSELYSVVGAAGELMSFRKSLYEPLEEDTILDDFMQSMRICLKGYTVKYTAQAYAMETASFNTAEEWKRKVRICAGGWQSMVRLGRVLNPFYNPILTFCYISHRVLRWSLAPVALVILLVSNLILALLGSWFFTLVLGLQILFYLLAYQGHQLEKKNQKSKLTSIPFYFTMMNLAVFYGFVRFVKGSQKSTWERARRA